MSKPSLRFAVLFIAIVAVGVVVNTWAYLGEAHVDRKQLKDFPLQMGEWRRVRPDTVLDDATMAVLRASDYLLRDYYTADGHIANFYVGYYASQREGASYHSPLNCLPGSGWTLSEPGKVMISAPDGSQFAANKYIIDNGDNRSLMLYWYQGRGRVIADEYANRLWLMFDAAVRHRSNGALVRVAAPVRSAVGAMTTADAAAADFTRTLFPHLSRSLP